MTEHLETWRRALEDIGMKTSRPTTQFLDFNLGQDNGQGREPVKILGEELQRVHHFKYLGSSVEETGGMATEITQRMSAAWRNWKRCSGVLCDRRMPVKLKGKVYTLVVRPALLYGAETSATTRCQEARLGMLRWGCWDGCAEWQGGIRSEMNTLEGQQEWCKRPRKFQSNDWNGTAMWEEWKSEKNARCGHTREKKKRVAKPKIERCV